MQFIDNIANKKAKAAVITLKIVQGIAKDVASGGYITDACQKRGIEYRDLRRACVENEEFETILKDAKEYRKHFLKEKALDSIVSKFKRDWKAGAWYLERAFPNEYGKDRNGEESAETETMFVVELNKKCE